MCLIGEACVEEYAGNIMVHNIIILCVNNMLSWFIIIIMACMDVKSGFLVMILLVTCVFRGGNAPIRYRVCPSASAL